jgi:pimeloyl-ACP methyl ester carboxylesterase
MDKLKTVLSKENSLIIVGSSFGGLMAAIFACENPRAVKKLVLLSPALPFSEFEPYLTQRIQIPVTICHGKNDDVVPLESAYEIAKRVFENLEFMILDDDHLLSKSFKGIDWDDLLEAHPH